VTAASQWLHATTGRIATCPHSWLTAVHWVSSFAAKGLYTPTQTHGPKWGPTTLAIAQEIAALKVCRPGIAYLMRKLKTSERTIQYHLTMLRETGLLVYRSKGTRARGEANTASVYERTIPAAFDAEHGIRTVGAGVQRRPVGAAAESRSALGKLAKKAARKTRRRPSRTPVSGRGRCTPMEGGSTGTSSADRTYSPSESKLASGNGKSSTRRSAKRGPRKLNKIGRRYRLGREATTVIPWLHGASVPRISWVLKDFADAGWSVREVQAVAESIPMPAYGVKRPSGMLADRLRGKARMTATMRAAYVAMWEESKAAAKDRHTGYDSLGTGPTSPAARRAMDEAFTAIRDRLAAEMEPAEPLEPEDPEPLTIHDLDKATVLEMRAEATRNPDFILDTIALGMTEQDARQLFTHWLVDQALKQHALTQPAF